MLIADVDWDQSHWTIQATQHSLNGHRQHASFRWQQATGTRAATFAEVFHRIAFRKQLSKIFTKNR
ncbi:Uncharacterised protein [Vibrio cholerae]|nr:Uncharacterised protein [Vibrio cholerae]